MRRAWFVVLVACRSSTPAADAAVSAPPSASLAAPVAARSVAAAPVLVVVADPTPEDWKKYWDAMKRGRAATVQKKYADAIKAFDGAVAVVPRDARARSERGYAKFLSGDNTGAASDFDEAADRVPANDKKLAAQIYFNQALAAEKAGADAVAAGYYRQSYELNPTAAAKAKMSSCGVIISSFATDIVANRAAALASIKTSSGATSFDEDLGDDLVGAQGDGDRAFALLKIGSRIAVFDTHADVTMGAKGRSGDVGIEQKGNEWIVTAQAKVPGEMACVAEGPCTSTAPVEGGTRDVFYVDAATGAPLWHVSYDYSLETSVNRAIEAGSLHVTGAGCDVVSKRPTQ
jgi:hypothetical protein